MPSEKIGGWSLTAVAAAGLAYCYVASAPVLTLHAIRGGLALVKPRGEVLLLSFLAAFLGAPAAAWCIARALGDARALSWLLTVGIAAIQIGLIAYAQRGRFLRINSFYDQLVRARLSEKAERGDFTDSYRHLREHGNAKTIIVFEVFLGVIVGTAQSGADLIVLLVIWLLPAAYVWFIASVLEAHFAETRGGITGASPGEAPHSRT
jgi:hypothetical protein